MKEYTIEQFINHIEKIKDDYEFFEITDVLVKTDSDNYPFMKWEKCYEQDICPKYCMCEFIDKDSELYDENAKCEHLNFPFYGKQWETGINGDSWSGELVYDLKHYWVKVSVSI